MPLTVADDVDLAPYTTLELGGPAEHFARVQDRDSLLEALRWAAEQAVPVTVLGGGSNVVVADHGVAGLVVQLATRGLQLRREGDTVWATVEAGERWDDFVLAAVSNELAGVECLSGIPGSVGATPIQNVGAYGQEVEHVIDAVEILDRASLQTRLWAASECEFAYRSSRFKREPDRHIVLSVRFALRKGAAPDLRYPELALRLAAASGKAAPSLQQVRTEVLALRRKKSMLIEPQDENRRSAGSFFLNPVVSPEQADAVQARARALPAAGTPPSYPQPDGRVKLSAAWLIEHSGTHKGERVGHVGVSSRHALALVHHGGGTSAELLALARQISARVEATFGVHLEREPVLLGLQ